VPFRAFSDSQKLEFVNNKSGAHDNITGSIETRPFTMWACVRLALITLMPVRTFSYSQKLELVDNKSGAHENVTGSIKK
jgi:hypothetical protein